MSALMSRPDPAVLSVGTLHSLEWFWVSRRIFIYSHHNTFVFFSKTSVCLSIHPSVHLSRIPCPLCRAYSSGWIHLIFLHLIKQLQKVGCVQSFVQNLNFCQFLKICNFDFVLFWHGIWCESLVGGNHGVAGGISECRRSSCSSLVLGTWALSPETFLTIKQKIARSPESYHMWDSFVEPNT